MRTTSVVSLLALVIFLGSAGFAQDTSLFHVEIESFDDVPAPSLSMNLPLSAMVSLTEQAGDLSAMLNEADSNCDQIRALAREISGKDNLTLADTKRDSVSISLRIVDGIFEIKLDDADTTHRFRYPAAVFEAVYSSGPDCKVSKYLETISALQVPYLLLGEFRKSGKLVMRARIWIDRDGQDPPAWISP